MPAEWRARLIVLDTGPLITLAVAESLDYLLYPNLPIVIPDAVLYEATRDAARLGAVAILDWVQKQPERVQTIPTETLFNHLSALSLDPTIRVRNLGENAAMEVVRYATHLAEGEKALLLTEDDGMLKISRQGGDLFSDMIALTTHDFLVELEAAKRINSVAEVYRRVNDAGRLASRRQALREQHERALAAVQVAMKPPA